MTFGLEKNAKATSVKGRLEKSTSIELDNTTEIKELEKEEVYEYLGVNKSNEISRCHHGKENKKRMLEYGPFLD